MILLKAHGCIAWAVRSIQGWQSYSTMNSQIASAQRGMGSFWASDSQLVIIHYQHYYHFIYPNISISLGGKKKKEKRKKERPKIFTHAPFDLPPLSTSPAQSAASPASSGTWSTWSISTRDGIIIFLDTSYTHSLPRIQSHIPSSTNQTSTRVYANRTLPIRICQSKPPRPRPAHSMKMKLIIVSCVGPERLVVAQHLTMIAALNPRFVVDYRLWESVGLYLVRSTGYVTICFLRCYEISERCLYTLFRVNVL